jgi:hypothetical protein
MATTKKQVWFGMRLTPEQKRQIEWLAERQGLSQKEVLMRLVEEAVAEDEQPLDARKGSFLDGIEHLIGSGEGPRDLLRDPDRMKGYGE